MDRDVRSWYSPSNVGGGSVGLLRDLRLGAACSRTCSAVRPVHSRAAAGGASATLGPVGPEALLGSDTCVREATALAISAKSRAAFSESLNHAGSLSCLRWSPENGCAQTFLMLLIFETNRRSSPISRKSASGGGEPGFQIDSITANMSDRSPLSLMLSTVGTELRLICGSPSRLQLPLLSAATAILCTKGDKLGPMGSSIEFKRLAASLSAVRSEFEVIVSICTHWYRLDVRWEHQVSDAS